MGTSGIALITGITGQDGSYLAELLLEKGYEVIGLVRRSSSPEQQRERIEHILDDITIEVADVTDVFSVRRVLEKHTPDEVYHLAAMSDVEISFKLPAFTYEVNAIGTANLLESCLCICPECRFYNAASSEMYGLTQNEYGMQDELTPMQPVSPYGISKLTAYHTTKMYRYGYDLHASNGILFNHSSARRGQRFILPKVVKGVMDIRAGKQSKLLLGNMNTHRDFGHSRDYVRAMHMILQHDKAVDVCIASGQTHLILDVVRKVFKRFDMNMAEYVQVDKTLLRPRELTYLKGDATYAKMLLEWEPEFTLDDIIEELIECYS
jgi:GDPmannose 4,6-dehydratase